MTIYYVDPINGSNSNSGLSWGAAWKWPPGNGAAVAPGDEIRFAKSPEKSPAGNVSANASTFWTLTSSPLSYTSVTLPTTWTLGSGGGSVSGATLTIPANTVVPANTKLMYAALSRTQTTLNGLEAVLQLLNIPSSVPLGNLRVRLCSDAAGNTPILDLDGPTWLSTFAKADVSYLYNSASTLNFTCASIAVYSISSFTIPAGASAQITALTRLFIMANQDTGTFLRRGSVVRWNSPRTPVSGFDGDLVNGLPDFYGYCRAISPTPTATPDPTWRMPTTTTTNNFSSTYTHYKGLPVALPAVYEAALTYAGNSGARIKFSGGWDTSSGLQDGYTNLALDQMWKAQRKGSFVFSAGGEWIDFERFIALQTHLIQYEYTVSQIHGNRFFDCTLGVPTHGTSQFFPSIYSAAAISSPVSIDLLYMERCTPADWFSFSRGDAFASSGGQSWWAASDVVFGGVDLVDCRIHRPGSQMAYVNCPSGDVKIRSSVVDEVRSMVVSAGIAEFSLGPSSAATLSVHDTALVVSAFFDMKGGGGGAATLAKGVFRNIYMTDFGATVGSASIGVYVGDFLELTVDGYAFHSSNTSSRPGTSLAVENSSTFYANNPTAWMKLGGPVYSAFSGNLTQWKYDALRLINPPAIVDFADAVRPISQHPSASFSRWPGLVVESWTGTVTIRNFYGSYIHFTDPSYTAGTYWPNIPQGIVENSVGRVSSSAHIGIVRHFGGQALSSGAFALGYNTPNPVGPGMLTYGAQIDYLKDRHVFSTLEGYQDKRSIGSGLTGSNIALGFESVGSFFLGVPLLVSLEESATLATPTTGACDYRGILLRKPSGWFHFRRSDKSIESDDVVNAYGKRTITMPAKSGMMLARLDVVGGQNIAITIRLRCLDAISKIGGFYRCSIIIPPCTAYTTELSGHYIRKNFTTNEDDTIISFNIAPQKTGEVYINLRTTVNLEIKDFTTAIV